MGKMALLGADLVIELPVVYALSSAEYFAYGGGKILNDIEFRLSGFEVK